MELKTLFPADLAMITAGVGLNTHVTSSSSTLGQTIGLPTTISWLLNA